MVQRERRGEPLPADGGVLALAPARPADSRWGYRLVKRAADLLLAGTALAALSPVLLVIALCIKGEDGGPVLYESVRMGQNGKAISVWKFRTMGAGGGAPEEALSPRELAAYYKEYKLEDDPRVTRVGRWLRRSSLDELPQLVNILQGDMSVVGPRPIVERELYEKYTREQQSLLLSVKPGLTGAWQVNGRSGCTYESGARQQVELRYVECRSVAADVGILLKTIPVTLLKIGAR